MDKIAMKQLFKGCGFPVLEGVWFGRDAWEKDPMAALEAVDIVRVHNVRDNVQAVRVVQALFPADQPAAR